MPKTPEELEKMFTDLSDKQALSEKQFQEKLDMANRDVKQYKDMAEANAEKLRTFQKDAEKREKELKESAAQTREKEVSEFVETQVKAGRMIPALKEKMMKFMSSLDSESKIMEFSEKDGSKRSHSPMSLFKELILKMKPVMPVNQEFSVQGEHEAEEAEGSENPVETFQEVIVRGERKKLPVEGADISAKAFDYQDKSAKAGRPISYAEALIAVSPKKSAAKA